MKSPTSLSTCWLSCILLSTCWLSCILLSTGPALQSQTTDYTDYYELTIQAREHFDKGEYLATIALLNEAFHRVPVPACRDLNKGIHAAVRARDGVQVQTYCHQVAKLYGIVPLPSFDADTLWFSEVNGSLIEVMERAQAGWDQYYIAVIDSLHAADQVLRQYGQVIYADGINSDSLRMHRLLQLIDERGFPAAHRVGPRGYARSHMIFLHADFDINNVLLGDLMLGHVMNGEMDPRDYASIIDRRCNFRGAPLEYYQVPFGYDELPTEEKAIITARRRAIGLRSVEDSMAIEWLENGDLRTVYKY